MTDTMIQTTDNLPPRDHNNPPSLLDADGLLLKFGSAEQPGVYTDLANSVTALLATLRETVPQTVETEQQNGIIAAHMEELRTTIKTVLNHHEHEKAPFLAAGRFCDQHFFALRDRLTKARDILQAKGDDYTRRKVAEERAERARVAAEEARKANEARIEAARLAAEAAAFQAAADRARKPENIAALETKAEQVGNQAAIVQVDTMIADSRAENAHLATLASSAALARTRHDTGHLSTAKQVPHVEIVDKTQLDLNALLPFIKEDVLLAAVKAWAKITDHKKQMAGAIIEMRDKADYR